MSQLNFYLKKYIFFALILLIAFPTESFSQNKSGLPIQIEYEDHSDGKLVSTSTLWIKDEKTMRKENIFETKAMMGDALKASDSIAKVDTKNDKDGSKAMANKLMGGMMEAYKTQLKEHMDKNPQSPKSIMVWNKSGIYSWTENDPRHEVLKLDDIKAETQVSPYYYLGNFSELKKAGLMAKKIKSGKVKGQAATLYHILPVDGGKDVWSDASGLATLKDMKVWTSQADHRPLMSRSSGNVMGKASVVTTVFKQYKTKVSAPDSLFQPPSGYKVVLSSDQKKQLKKSQEDMRKALEESRLKTKKSKK